MRHVGAVRLIAALALLVPGLTGCGSSGSSTPATASRGLTPIDKIVEYRGDGGGGAKPLPLGIDLPVDLPASKAPKLTLDDGPFQRAVPARHISWYRIGQISTNTTVVVCLQPTADEDADLYVLAGTGSGYGTGAATLTKSTRYPTDPGGEPGMFGAGLVPDWAAFTIGNTAKYPAAQIAVFGVAGGPSNKHYRIEACSVPELIVNGGAGAGSLSQYSSHFYYFTAASGTQYTVQLSSSAGDPDVYVYESQSTGYVGADATPGGGSHTFTATASGRHYIRVHGYSPTDSGYGILVTSP